MNMKILQYCESISNMQTTCKYLQSNMAKVAVRIGPKHFELTSISLEQGQRYGLQSCTEKDNYCNDTVGDFRL